MQQQFLAGHTRQPAFTEFPLSPPLIARLKERSITHAFPIQALAIPELLAGHDVIGLAQTGSGKTLAFLLPIIERLSFREHSGQALILAPTRELAIQIHAEALHYSRGTNLRTGLFYGFGNEAAQSEMIRSRPQLIVGSPGRIARFIKSGELRLGNIDFLVLDEFDNMLGRGFGRHLKLIIDVVRESPHRQTALFSATAPQSPEIREMVSTLMPTPKRLNPDRERLPENISHHLIFCGPQGDDKLSRLLSVISALDFRRHSLMVFRARKVDVEDLYAALSQLTNVPVERIHGDLWQHEREQALGRFRSGQARILVASDVIHRGIDVPSTTHVLSMDMPFRMMDYAHRSGRTGRAGQAGHSIQFITTFERRLLPRLQQATRVPFSTISAELLENTSALKQLLEVGPFDPFLGMRLRPSPGNGA